MCPSVMCRYIIVSVMTCVDIKNYTRKMITNRKYFFTFDIINSFLTICPQLYNYIRKYVGTTIASKIVFQS